MQNRSPSRAEKDINWGLYLLVGIILWICVSYYNGEREYIHKNDINRKIYDLCLDDYLKPSEFKSRIKRLCACYTKTIPIDFTESEKNTLIIATEIRAGKGGYVPPEQMDAANQIYYRAENNLQKCFAYIDGRGTAPFDRSSEADIFKKRCMYMLDSNNNKSRQANHVCDCYSKHILTEISSSSRQSLLGLSNIALGKGGTINMDELKSGTLQNTTAKANAILEKCIASTVSR